MFRYSHHVSGLLGLSPAMLLWPAVRLFEIGMRIAAKPGPSSCFDMFVAESSHHFVLVV